MLINHISSLSILGLLHWKLVAYNISEAEATVNNLIVKMCRIKFICTVNTAVCGCCMSPRDITEVRYNAREGRSDEPNQWVGELDLFSHFIVNQINLFAFQLTDSSFIMSDHLLHGWFQSLQVLSSGRTRAISVIPPICPLSLPAISLFSVSECVCMHWMTGSETPLSGLSQANTLSHSYSHMWKSQRLQLGWPARLWTAGGN